MADINSYGIVNDGSYEYKEAAEQESITPYQLHELAMAYLAQTAYAGITPEQLVDEYLLAVEHINDHVKVQRQDTVPTEPSVQGHKLEDGIPH